jgi:hypothetical protein
MDELFPIGAGIILGLLFASQVRILRAIWVRVSIVVLIGVAATVLSGEYHDNWGFVLVDIGEVALAAWITATVARLVLPVCAHQARSCATNRENELRPGQNQSGAVTCRPSFTDRATIVGSRATQIPRTLVANQT